MKKIVIADFVEYNDQVNKLGSYHYAKNFAKDNYEVLWMSCLWNSLTYIKDKKSYNYRKSISTPTKHVLDENVYGFAPYSKRLYGKYPFCTSANIVFNNHKYIAPDIKQSLRLIGFDKVDILWISNLKQYWLVNVIDYNKLVFRIPDNFTDASIYPKSIGEIENRLIDDSDIIFVTAKSLMKKVEKRNKRAYFLPNGADYEHFQNIYKMPKEYEESNKNKIIYVGAIDYWFDVDLVRYIAQNLDIDIFLIGNPKINLDIYKEQKNIHILGSRKYDEIPNYLAFADVAIIPFKKDSFTDSINPIKLFEYCSVGIPTVCSNLEEVKKLDAPVCVATNYDEFSTGISRYLEKKYDPKNIKEFGRTNSWKNRYEQVLKVIKE